MKLKKKTILIAVSGQETGKKDALDALCCMDAFRRGLLHLGAIPEPFYVREVDFLQPKALLKKILELNPAVVFNLFEGFVGDSQKEVEFASILEQSGICFTGNSAQTLKICLNKQKVKNILSKGNISIPQGCLVRKIEDLETLRINTPVFIKPCCEDASIGIDHGSLVWEKQKLHDFVKTKLREFPAGVIVEDFIEGKEYSLGFLGREKFELMGISEMDYGLHADCVPFLSYKAKWDTGSELFKKLMPDYNIKIFPQQKRKMVMIAMKSAALLGCRGYFRVDLREREGAFFVLDVNPNPDINIDSGFMKQSKNSGYSFESVIKKILNAAYGPLKE